MTKEDVIGWLEFLSKEEHVKADGIVPCDTEIALGMAIKALKQPEIVRCKDCCSWKPPHIRLNDGRQRLYRDGEKSDPLHIGVSMDVGINIGGKCWVDHNCGYGRDMRVFRKENDYCSRATKLPEGTTAEQYWGLSEEPAELLDD